MHSLISLYQKSMTPMRVMDICLYCDILGNYLFLTFFEDSIEYQLGSTACLRMTSNSI